MEAQATDKVYKFQYPLRVEVGCNADSPAAVPGDVYVSVPSTGRSGLQPAPLLELEAGSRFQYPLRVEVGCNTVDTGVWRACAMFQYPLRVEVGCNGQ